MKDFKRYGVEVGQKYVVKHAADNDLPVTIVGINSETDSVLIFRANGIHEQISCSRFIRHFDLIA